MNSPLSDILLDEVHDLTFACLGGEATPVEVRRLEELLLGSEDARRIYENAIQDSFILHRWAAAEGLRADGAFNADDADADWSPVAIDSAEKLPDLSEAMRPRSSVLHNACHGTVSYFSQVGPLSYLIATVVLCAMLLGAWAYKIANHPHIVHDKTTPIKNIESQYVGRITGMNDCVWAEGSFAPMGGASVPMGRKYELSSGLMEITYTSGARVILEGPCEYTVDSSAGGYLQRGKLTARVETKAEGGRRKAEKGSVAKSEPSSLTPHPSSLFTVTTPTAIVTDLGTEFGVEVSKTGRTKTQVFDGSVRITKIISSSAPGEGRIIIAGQSGIVDSNDPTIRVANDHSTTFVRIIPGSAPYLDNNAYAKLVMSLGPVAYYRMERPEYGKDRTTVYDSVPGKRHGILRTISQAGEHGRELNATPLDGGFQKSGPIPGNNRDAEKAAQTTGNTFAAPSFSTSAKEGDHAIEFTRGRHGVMDARAAFSPLLITDGFSCSCWFKVVGDDQYFGRIFDMRTASTNWTGLSIYVDQSANGDMDGNSGTIGLDLDYTVKGGRLPIQYAPDSIPVGEWCNIVVTCSAQYWDDKAAGYVTDVALYLNGSRIAGGTEYAVGGTLSFGNHAMCLQSSQSKHDREFGGLIDEAAIFNRVLSLDEVRRLYKGPITVGNRHNNPETTIDRSVNGKENKTVIDP